MLSEKKIANLAYDVDTGGKLFKIIPGANATLRGRQNPKAS